MEEGGRIGCIIGGEPRGRCVFRGNFVLREVCFGGPAPLWRGVAHVDTLMIG